MLRLSSVQVESLWDDVLPDEVRALPEDLAALDELLRDPQTTLLAAIEQRWQRDAERLAARRRRCGGRRSRSLRMCG